MNIKQIIGTFLVAITFGTIGGLFFWALALFGFIKIRGYWKLWRQVWRGQTIVAANHPTLLETFLLPVMFWPFGVFHQRFFMWSAPDRGLFPDWLNWLYDWGHCVKVKRDGGNTGAMKQVLRLLKSGATIIMHPEGGRTLSPDRGKPEGKQTKHVQSPCGDRRVRKFRTKVTSIASKSGATVVPVWINMPFYHDAHGFHDALWAWFRGGYTIKILVGDSFVFPGPREGFEKRRADSVLAARLFAA